MAFKFEKLKVWQIAIELSFRIHQLTKLFPKDELFVLTPQIKRAADSIVLNIAEGSTGQTNAEFRLFLGYAIRSAIEVVSCLYIARKRSLIKDSDFKELYVETENLVKMLQALRKRLERE
jgi:four helix bundle protein